MLSSSILRRLFASKRREAAANAEIDPRRRIVRVNAIHVIALFVGHHFERQLVVIAQEHRPLAVLRNRRRLLEDVDDRKPILHLQRHEHPRHEREMEIHVRLVALAEISDRVFRPLIGLRQKHAAREIRVDVRAQFHQVFVRLAQIFAARSFAFVEVGNGVEPQAVDAHARARNRAPSARARAPPGYRNSGPADARRSGASNTPSPPDPTTSSRSRNP